MTGRRTKVALRVAAGLLSALFLVYGGLALTSVHSKRQAVTGLGFGALLAVYASFGRTGLRALDG